MSDLVSTDDLLTALGIPPSTTAKYQRYDLLRLWVEDAIRKYCKWEISAHAGEVEYHNGTGYIDITLNKPYATSVTNVWVDQTGAYGSGPSAFTGTALTQGTDYALVIDSGTTYSKSGIIRRLTNNYMYWFPSDIVYYKSLGGLSYRQGPVWPQGIGNVKVTYSYGFSVIPNDIKLAVTTAVGTAVNSVKYGFPYSSESLGAHSVSVAVAMDPQFGAVRQLLSRYRDSSV